MKKKSKKDPFGEIDLNNDFGETDPLVVKSMTMSNDEKGRFNGDKFIEILKKQRAKEVENRNGK